MDLEGKIVGLTNKTEDIAKKLTIFLKGALKIKKNPIKMLTNKNINVVKKWVDKNIGKKKIKIKK